MKADDLRALESDQLKLRLDEMKRELFQLRMDLHSGQLTNTNRLKDVRRDIARAITVLGEQAAAQRTAETRSA